MKKFPPFVILLAGTVIVLGVFLIPRSGLARRPRGNRATESRHVEGREEGKEKVDPRDAPSSDDGSSKPAPAENPLHPFIIHHCSGDQAGYLLQYYRTDLSNLAAHHVNFRE